LQAHRQPQETTQETRHVASLILFAAINPKPDHLERLAHVHQAGAVGLGARQQRSALVHRLKDLFQGIKPDFCLHVELLQVLPRRSAAVAPGERAERLQPARNCRAESLLATKV